MMPGIEHVNSTLVSDFAGLSQCLPITSALRFRCFEYAILSICRYPANCKGRRHFAVSQAIGILPSIFFKPDNLGAYCNEPIQLQAILKMYNTPEYAQTVWFPTGLLQ